MGLTHQQHITLSKYLKAVGIKEQEPFEEFYDHIATGFERSQIQDLQHYIERIVEPDFGGTNGMLRIVRNQNKHRRGQYPENCVNEVRQKDRTFYIRLKNTQL
jgi:hypothetical protein